LPRPYPANEPLGEVVPLGHAVQPVPPVLERYLPAGHAVQLVPPVLERYLPAAHAVQLVPPVLERYLPAAHAVQLVPPDETVPCIDTFPLYPLLVSCSPPKHQMLYPSKSPPPFPANTDKRAQSTLSDPPSPTPMRSVLTPLIPTEADTVPTLLHIPAFHVELPVFARLLPMQPVMIECNDLPLYPLFSLY
jgi:hypothetical protein